jgi:hypothetical protein
VHFMPPKSPLQKRDRDAVEYTDMAASMTTYTSRQLTMEMGPMGPIGEGASLMLRVNRNCPWNKCLFCHVYKESTFSVRGKDEVKADIDAAARVQRLLEAVSFDIGLSGRINREVAGEVVRRNLAIYGGPDDHRSHGQWLALQSLRNITNWLAQGARRVFLQDANGLYMKHKDLVEVLHHLRASFPTVDSVTCYARSRTCAQRSVEELRKLHDAGLVWAFVGIESGCNEVLDYMRKGATRTEHLAGGVKLKESGISMATFVMPGLAGRQKELSRKHIAETISLLNELKPAEVRVRSLAIMEGVPLYERWRSGEFTHPTDDQMINELEQILEGLTFDCVFETLQLTNVFTMKGHLSAKRGAWLADIARYRALTPVERAHFVLHRYLSDGYLDCVKSWGLHDARLQTLIREAAQSVQARSADALEKVDRAIVAIKSKGIP